MSMSQLNVKVPRPHMHLDVQRLPPKPHVPSSTYCSPPMPYPGTEQHKPQKKEADALTWLLRTL
ncbi:uncharacterized protein H6S33_005293 [Morchella sextelata]|uniref:uncharacterized protein n=1 Tax=Morchella sextelata TaxID=1174677 RepID=UPI001D0430AC|nr:uncharacterized protein H6S33_005293 [Morchella sextelata]KAH0613407.1 hypothetical protein H6S33_005293 [Morchella sextelata]